MTKPLMDEDVRSALVTTDRSSDIALVWRVDRCGGEDWVGQFRCRTPACRRCRWRYMRQQQRHAQKRFGDASRDQLAMLSVIIGVVSSVEEVGEVFKTFGKDLRNLVDAERRRSTRWHGVEIMTWLETDAFHGDDYRRLGSDKTRQFGEIAPCLFWTGKPVWIVTVHGLVNTGLVGIEGVRNTLRDRWKAHRQIDLRALHHNRQTKDNIDRVVSYSLKHRCSSNLDGESVEWPPAWKAAYFSWLHSWSRGFHRLRLTIGPKKMPTTKSTNKPDIVIDPLPFVYDFSISHTLYN